MNQDFRGRALALFQVIQPLDVHQRAAQLDALCAGDPDLRGEIESLLAAYDEAPAFLDEPAVRTASAWIAEDEKSQSFGPWRVRAEIGRGGMATVYEAERADDMFRKKAALKILRFGIYGDDVRLRFERERQILADLDHPFIVRLLDGGVAADGRPYLVMDLLDGSSLMESVTTQGLTLQQRITLFLKICEGVEHAHAHQVIHRDLKPSNIRITSDGLPKILDFGIAKLVAAETQPIELTRTGARFLTLEYASPEQAQGLPTGPATDVYSLGLILYELVTLRRMRQVEGLTPFEATKRICEMDPEVRTGTPYDAAICGALQPDPGRRFASVAALRAAVENPCPRRTNRWRIWAAAAIPAALGAAATLTMLTRQPNSTPQPVLMRITSLPGAEKQPSFSKDGRRLLYWKNNVIYEHQLGSSSHRQVARNEDGIHRAELGKDGQLAYWRTTSEGSNHLVVDQGGGSSPHELAENRDLTQLYFSWAPDGESIAYAGRPVSVEPWAVFVVDMAGTRRQVTFPGKRALGDVACSYSPDGKEIAFVRFQTGNISDLFLLSLATGKERQLTSDGAFIRGLDWTPDGKEIVYSARRTSTQHALWRIPAAGGEPRKVAGVPEGAITPAIARTIQHPWRLAFELEERDVNIWKWSRDSQPVPVLASQAFDLTPAVSPTGGRLAFSSAREGWYEIWTSSRDGLRPVRLTYFNGPPADWPQWSPDEREITFVVQGRDARKVYLMDSTGGRPRTLLSNSPNTGEEGRPNFSRDGRWVYFRSDRSGRGEIWKAKASDGSESQQVTRIGAYEGKEAPDGRRLFFMKSRDEPGLWEQTLPAGEPHLAIATARDVYWDMSDVGIYYVERPLRYVGGRVMVYRFDTRRSELVVALPKDGRNLYGGFSVSRDGKSIYWAQHDKEDGDVLMLENFR